MNLSTVTSQGLGHMAQKRGAEWASFEELIPLGSREEAGVLSLVGRCQNPLPCWSLGPGWGFHHHLGE